MYILLLINQGGFILDKYNKNQLVEAIRTDIMGEFEAINQYQRHIDSTDNQAAIKIWENIRNEEEVHVGELLTLLAIFNPRQAVAIEKGESEVKRLLDGMGYNFDDVL